MDLIKILKIVILKVGYYLKVKKIKMGKLIKMKFMIPLNNFLNKIYLKMIKISLIKLKIIQFMILIFKILKTQTKI